MNKTFSFKVGACYSGDLIYLLKGIKSVCEFHDRKADIYIWLDRPVKAYDGAQHPYGGAGFNDYAFRMLKPLLLSQSYINSIQEFKGQDVKVDLDDLRTKIIGPMPYGSIQRWSGYAWPDQQPSEDDVWIFADPALGVGGPANGKILINRTSRYQNSLVHYWFIRELQDQVIFSGLPEEHETFCKQHDLKIPLLEVKDFLELAAAMNCCRYFIGNQSMCFALAEALRIPRLLEVCPYAPNVIPSGLHGYDFLHQFALEWFVKDSSSPLNNL